MIDINLIHEFNGEEVVSMVPFRDVIFVASKTRVYVISQGAHGYEMRIRNQTVGEFKIISADRPDDS